MFFNVHTCLQYAFGFFSKLYSYIIQCSYITFVFCQCFPNSIFNSFDTLLFFLMSLFEFNIIITFYGRCASVCMGCWEIFCCIIKQNPKPCRVLYEEVKYEQVVLEIYYHTKAKAKMANNMYIYYSIHCK